MLIPILMGCFIIVFLIMWFVCSDDGDETNDDLTSHFDMIDQEFRDEDENG